MNVATVTAQQSDRLHPSWQILEWTAGSFERDSTSSLAEYGGTELHRRAASIRIIRVGIQRFERADPFDGKAVDGVFVADADRQHATSSCVQLCVDQPETTSRMIGHVELHAGKPSEVAADAAST